MMEPWSGMFFAARSFIGQLACMRALLSRRLFLVDDRKEFRMLALVALVVVRQYLRAVMGCFRDCSRGALFHSNVPSSNRDYES